MLLGTYFYQMDAKGRIFLPKKFQKENNKKLIIARGFDRYLSVYQVEEFEKLVEKIRKLPIEALKKRHYLRLIYANAEDVEIDVQGRMLIPPELRKYASLDKGEVVIFGVIDHLEIWNERSWKEFKKRREIADIAKKIIRIIRRKENG